MSHSYAWPQEQTAASAAAAQAGQRAARADLGAAVMLSALPQAFDLAVTGLAALAVFPSVFFGALAPGAAIAAGIALWALAYVVATAVARWLPARALQGKAAARGLLTLATVAISLLPVAGHAAWAPAALILARSLQGLAIGRLGSGLTPRADAAQRRVAGQSWGIALAAAIILAGALAAGLGFGLGREDLIAWGWRYPFFIALALNLAAFAADLALDRAASDAPTMRGHQRPRLATVDGVRLV